MDMKQKTLENLARRMAKRQGHVLVKIRRRDPYATDFGAYRLLNHGVVLVSAAPLETIIRMLKRLDVMLATPESDGLKILTVLLKAASAAGWCAIPPEGGASMPLAEAIPQIVRDFGEGHDDKGP